MEENNCDYKDFYSVKSEVKTLLTQIQRHTQKFLRLYNDMSERNNVSEVIEKLCNDNYIKIVKNFYTIIDRSEYVKKSNKKESPFKITEELFKMKEESELYKKRKLEIEEIKTKFFSNNDIKLEIQESEKIKAIESGVLIENMNSISNENHSTQNNSQNHLIKKIFSKCYICKNTLTQIHHFYPSLCIKCGDISYKIRELELDLTGRIAIVTGARIKIGYTTALKLLRFKCRVIATTRFPKDALLRFMKEPDFETFRNNLYIYPLDLRMFRSIDNFIKYIEKHFPHLDILINNAAQTNRRSANYYKYLLDIETKPLSDDLEKIIIKSEENFIKVLFENLSEDEKVYTENNYLQRSLVDMRDGDGINSQNYLPDSVVYSQKEFINENKSIFDPNIVGNDLQPVDFSKKTSWNLQLDEVNFVEFAEVQIINSWAPFYLCKNLKHIFMKSSFSDRYIVNVTGAEGRFFRNKNSNHPHTNMAKSALNMMTYTSARYFRKFNIYMSSVDTGWISCMQEFGSLNNDSNLNAEDFEQFYINVPLDESDGAMRILQPVIEGTKYGNFLYGCMLRNYKVVDWFS